MLPDHFLEIVFKRFGEIENKYNLRSFYVQAEKDGRREVLHVKCASQKECHIAEKIYVETPGISPKFYGAVPMPGGYRRNTSCGFFLISDAVGKFDVESTFFRVPKSLSETVSLSKARRDLGLSIYSLQRCINFTKIK